MYQTNIQPIIFGISNTYLTQAENDLFKNNHVLGFILFSRNVESSEQLRALTSELKNLYPERNVPIFIDQEGGRVARLKPPVVKNLFPSAEYFADIYQSDQEKARYELKTSYSQLMSELKQLGIDSPCAPVCDLRIKNASDVIGDRSFGEKPEQVIDLCEAAILSISSAGGIPFIKHIPGHGRALVDSHFELPIVKESLEELEKTDFFVFKQLAKHSVWGMTAHIIYEALDIKNTATTSEKVISYIRNHIGFKGKLVSDDICMYALHGKIGEQISLLKRVLKLASQNHEWKKIYSKKIEKILKADTENFSNATIIEKCKNKLQEIKPAFLINLAKIAKMSLDAGCDVVLHCSGDLEEMQAICRKLTY